MFTTKSLYSFLTNGGFANKLAGHLWKCKIPLKIKFFMWQVFNNKLQCAHSLTKRGWKGGEKCCLDDGSETVNHIFFGCVIAKMIWGDLPSSLDNMYQTWIRGKGPLPIRLLLFFFAEFLWALE